MCSAAEIQLEILEENRISQHNNGSDKNQNRNGRKIRGIHKRRWMHNTNTGTAYATMVEDAYQIQNRLCTQDHFDLLHFGSM